MSSTIQQTENNACGDDACDCATEQPKILDRKGVIGLARANAAKNKEFKKATRAQKRVMIAQDILNALGRGKLVAQSGAYVEPTYDDSVDDDANRKPDLDDGMNQLAKDESLQALLEKVTPCQVCAKGAIFLCTVAMRNQVTVGEFNDLQGGSGTINWGGEKLSKLLGGVFTPKQLATIENEFEQDQIDHLGPEPVMHLEDRFPDNETKRLRVIFRNVIRNEGTFKPVPIKDKVDADGYNQWGNFVGYVD